MGILRRIFGVGAVGMVLLAQAAWAGVGIEIDSNKTWNVTQNETNGTAGHGVWTTPGGLVVKNIGTDPAKIVVQGTNTNLWALSSSGVAGNNTFAINYLLAGTTAWAPITTSAVEISSALPAGQSLTADMKYESPVTINPVTTDLQQSTITVTCNSNAFGNWDIQTIPQIFENGWARISAFDSQNIPHFLFECSEPSDQSNTINDLSYAEWTGVAWAVSNVYQSDTSIEDMFQYTLAIDSCGAPCVFYSVYDRNFSKLIIKCARQNGANWINTVVTTITDTNSQEGDVWDSPWTVIVDSVGVIHATFEYLDSSNNVVQMCQIAVSGGQVQSHIDQLWSVNNFQINSAFIDSTGKIWNYNFNGVGSNFSYAYICSASLPQTPGVMLSLFDNLVWPNIGSIDYSNTQELSAPSKDGSVKLIFDWNGYTQMATMGNNGEVQSPQAIGQPLPAWSNYAKAIFDSNNNLVMLLQSGNTFSLYKYTSGGGLLTSTTLDIPSIQNIHEFDLDANDNPRIIYDSSENVVDSDGNSHWVTTTHYAIWK